MINRPSHWKSEVERRDQTRKALPLYPIDRHDDASRRSPVQGKREGKKGKSERISKRRNGPLVGIRRGRR